MSWHVAASLRTLDREITAAYPDRSEASDGFIGDAAHIARGSAHNPDRNGTVRAGDWTSHDKRGRPIPGFGDTILQAAMRHPAALLVIHNGHIWSRNHGWRKRVYRGSNPHRNHVHVSILNNIEGSFTARQLADAATNTSPWLTTSGLPSQPPTEEEELMSARSDILKSISANTQILSDLQARRARETVAAVTAALDGKLAGLRVAVEELHAGGIDDDTIARIEAAASSAAESGTTKALEDLPHLDVDQAVSDALGQARIVLED